MDPSTILVELLREDRDNYGMSFEECWAEDCRIATADLSPLERERALELLVSVKRGWRDAFERRGTGMSLDLIDDVGERIGLDEPASIGL